MEIIWRRRLDGIALGAMILLGLAAMAVMLAPEAIADTSRLWGVLHQAAAPARTEGEAATLTADLAGNLRVITAAGGGLLDTELPAAAALADNTANPTAPAVGAHLLAFDGAMWDRLLVGAGVEAGALRVTFPTDGTGVVNIAELPAAAALSDNAANPTTTTIGAALLAFDGATFDRVTIGGGVETTALRVSVATDNVVSVDDNAASLTVDNAALSVVGGGAEATALRVTVASDSTGVLSVDDNAGSLTVDNAALSVVGGGVEATALRVTIANDSTGLVSVDDNAGSLTIDNATLAVVGGGVEATAMRVTIASDSTGVLSVDDNAGSLTIDNATLSVTGGGVEATALRVTVATDNVLSVDDNAGSLTVDNAALSVVGGGTEATAQRVTIANDSTGLVSVDDGGTILSVDGLTSVGVAAGDLAKREDDVHGSLDAGVALWAVRRDTATSTAADGDYHPLLVNSLGALRTQADGVAVVASEFVALAADIQGVGAATGLRLQSVTLRETAAATAVFAFRHGTLATDPTITFVNLAASESKTIFAPAGGWNAPNGVFIDRISGTADVNLGTLTRSP